MTADRDRKFDDNLEALGTRIGVPGGASADVKTHCLDTLGGASRNTIRMAAFRRRAWWSTIGLAAAVTIVALPFFGNHMPQVKAAVVLNKLTEQIEGSDLFEVTIDQITVENKVWVNGILQLSDRAIAGDISAKVQDAIDGKPIEVDISLGISSEGGWILIRSLKIPDPDVQPFVDLLFPPGTETLILLPDKIIPKVMASNGQTAIGLGFEDGLGSELASGLSEVREAASGQVVDFIKQVIETEEDLGVTVEKQYDGTLLMTLPIKDADAFRDLVTFVATTMGEDPSEIDIDDSDIEELLGATFSVVYDPNAELVRSFSVTNVAEMQGTVTVALSSGEIDPDLLDQSRVTGPNTRVLDVSALPWLINALSGKFD